LIYTTAVLYELGKEVIKFKESACSCKTLKKSQAIYVRKTLTNIKTSAKCACYYKSRQIINEGIRFFASTTTLLITFRAEHNTWFWRGNFLTGIFNGRHNFIF